MIYMDYNATTPCDERVVEEMLPYFNNKFANSASLYRPARETRKAVEEARKNISLLVGVLPDEIFFTSGGTEADNWAIMATALKFQSKGKHIITSAIEHHAVLYTCKALEKQGFEVTYIPVDNYGIIDIEQLKNSIRKDTILITIMHANNEIGSIQPISEISAMAKEKGVIFHTDSVQTIGKIPCNLKELGPDMFSLSAHKFYGPKGIGALYIRKGLSIPPFIYGGGQEKGKRSGTTNVAGIVGFGKAAELAKQEMSTDIIYVKKLRDTLENKIKESIPEIILNGHPEKKLHNTINVCIKHIEGESILLSLDFEGICASSGSACTSGSLEPSHVLLAIGLPHEIAHGSLRLTLGKYNTMDEVEKVASVLPRVVERLRQISPFWQDKK
ncbi:cysteine desulfurase NifS [bacterium]|nr:cysteine desulfurase NifS [bacterium]